MKIKHLITLGLALSLGIASTMARHRSFGEGLPDYLQEFDVDENGQLDEEERQAAREARQARKEARRAEADTNGDGVLSDEEREAAREAHRAAIEEKRTERFNEIAGEDGAISAEEFAAIPGLADKDAERVAALFERLDSDDSGDVSSEEFLARLKKHKRGHKRPSPRHRHHRRGGERDDDGGDGGEGEGDGGAEA